MYICNNYYTRLERAKLHGRWFFDSLDESLKQLPVDVIKIIEQNPNWSIGFYSLYGEDGYTLFKYKNKQMKYKICVDSYGMVERKRFTIAHEIGHIVLGHFKQFHQNDLTTYEEYILDREADMFAGELLMPYQYMLEYHNWSVKGLSYKFHVSKEAARVRLNILKNDYMFLRDIGIIKSHSLAEELDNMVNFYNATKRR